MLASLGSFPGRCGQGCEGSQRCLQVWVSLEKDGCLPKGQITEPTGWPDWKRPDLFGSMYGAAGGRSRFVHALFSSAELGLSMLASYFFLGFGNVGQRQAIRNLLPGRLRYGCQATPVRINTNRFSTVAKHNLEWLFCSCRVVFCRESHFSEIQRFGCYFLAVNNTKSPHTHTLK